MFLPAGLGLVHRRVGIAQHVGGVFVAQAVGDHADAGGADHLVLAQPVGPGERGQQAVGREAGLVGAGGPVEQNDELVAAEARSNVVMPQFGQESLGDAHQQRVADRVAEAVVDRLEAVEVEEQHREVIVRIVAMATERALKLFQEALTVGQPGEPVVVGLLNQFVLGRLELGDLGERTRESDRFAPLIARDRRAAEHPPRIAVGVVHLQFDRKVGVFARPQPIQTLTQVGDLRRIHVTKPLLRGIDGVVFAQAQQLLPPRAEIHAVGGQVPVPQAIAAAANRQFHPLGVAGQRLPLVPQRAGRGLEDEQGLDEQQHERAAEQHGFGALQALQPPDGELVKSADRVLHQVQKRVALGS